MDFPPHFKIINNLLSNAFKFTSTEGKVAITAKQQGTRLAIAVSDTGKGISEEDQKQLFNRFYQSRSNTVHTAGTGVGLTLAKELAQLHKGDITINSAEGKGATFTFEFPFDKASTQISHSALALNFPVILIRILRCPVYSGEINKRNIHFFLKKIL